MNKLTADRLNELKTLVGQWADKNFKVHAPAIGILEEIGEAAHCILKRKQGIRGFDNEQYFKEQLKDAIADIAIYCFHAAHIEDMELFEMEEIRMNTPTDDAVTEVLGLMAEYSAHVMLGDPDNINDVMDCASTFAALHEINFADAVEETWAKVSQRDWKKNPTDAHAQTIELDVEASIRFAEAMKSEPREIPPVLKKMRDEIEGEREKSFDRDQA